jgi:hypothetical protein
MPIERRSLASALRDETASNEAAGSDVCAVGSVSCLALAGPAAPSRPHSSLLFINCRSASGLPAGTKIPQLDQ